MASFNWFGDTKHRVFNYKPIYFDPEKEERKRMFGHVDGSDKATEGSEKQAYSPGSYIQGSFRDGNYSRKKGGSRAQSIIGLVGLILVGAVLIYIAKFYMMLG